MKLKKISCLLLSLPLLAMISCNPDNPISTSSSSTSESSSAESSTTDSSFEDSSSEVSSSEISSSEISSSDPASSESSVSSSTPDSSSSESSIDSSSSVVYPDLADVLSSYSLGYKLEASVTAIEGSSTTYFCSDTQSEDGALTYRMYARSSSNPTREEARINETYIKGEDGLVYSTRLDVSNTITRYRLYNPLTSDQYHFDNDGYSNFFSLLSADSFVSNGEGVYELSVSDIAASISSSISTQLYGNPGNTLDSFRINLDEEGISSIEASLSFQGASTSYRYDFVATVTPLLEGEAIDRAYAPLEEVEDESFDNVKTNLGRNNYTLTISNYENDVLVSESIYKTTENGVYYKTPGYEEGEVYEMAYALTPEGLVQEAIKVGDQFVKSGEPMEGSLDELRPSLNFSRACFDYDETNDIYTLKDGVEGDTFCISILDALVTELADVTVSITARTGTITNISGSNKSVFHFDNLFTTDLGFTYESMVEPSTDTLLVDLVDEITKENLLNYMTAEDRDALVAPAGYNTGAWVDWNEEGLPMVMLAYSGETAATAEAINNYGSVIEELGYTAIEDSIYGGKAYVKDFTNNGEEDQSFIELVNFYDVFMILFTTMSDLSTMM